MAIYSCNRAKTHLDIKYSNNSLRKLLMSNGKDLLSELQEPNLKLIEFVDDGTVSMAEKGDKDISSMFQVMTLCSEHGSSISGPDSNSPCCSKRHLEVTIMGIWYEGKNCKLVLVKDISTIISN
jgi:hypothetical protein